MGDLKQQALKKDNEDITTHLLTDQEYNYIKMLNLTLQYHTYSSKIISGFLYYVSIQRLGYVNGVNLSYELDFDKDDKQLSVKLLSETPIDK